MWSLMRWEYRAVCGIFYLRKQIKALMNFVMNHVFSLIKLINFYVT